MSAFRYYRNYILPQPHTPTINLIPVRLPWNVNTINGTFNASHGMYVRTEDHGTVASNQAVQGDRLHCLGRQLCRGYSLWDKLCCVP